MNKTKYDYVELKELKTEDPENIAYKLEGTSLFYHFSIDQYVRFKSVLIAMLSCLEEKAPFYLNGYCLESFYYDVDGLSFAIIWFKNHEAEKNVGPLVEETITKFESFVNYIAKEKRNGF